MLIKDKLNQASLYQSKHWHCMYSSSSRCIVVPRYDAGDHSAIRALVPSLLLGETLETCTTTFPAKRIGAMSMFSVRLVRGVYLFVR